MKENNKKNIITKSGESKKRKKQIDKKKISICIILLIFIIYIIYTIYLLIKEPTNIFTVEEGKLYQEETVIGYVIRNERVVKGENYKNGIEQIKSEGEKAANNENIFRYYSQNEEVLKQKISELDIKIQEVMTKDSGYRTSEMKLLENQIDEKIANISKIKDTTKLSEYKKEIDDLVTKKAKIAGEASPQGSYLRQLIEERRQYESQLNSGAEYVKAPMSGIVSYRVDGLEETLTPGNFNNLTKKYLESLELKTGKIVATSEESGKVIDNFTCYIATITSSEDSKQANIGDDIKIRLSNNEEIPAEIINIINEESGERVIILKVTKQIKELTNYRKITLDLIWWSKSGIKIPNQAIVNIDGLDYVVRNRAGYLSKLLIEVKKKGQKYSIVESYNAERLKELGFSEKEILNYRKISLYDEILINPNIDKLK